MRGLLNRILIRECPLKSVTVVPSMGKLEAKYVFLDSLPTWDASQFFQKCSALSIEHVLVMVEEESQLETVKKALLAGVQGRYPERVYFLTGAC